MTTSTHNNNGALNTDSSKNTTNNMQNAKLNASMVLAHLDTMTDSNLQDFRSMKDVRGLVDWYFNLFSFKFTFRRDNFNFYDDFFF